MKTILHTLLIASLFPVALQAQDNQEYTTRKIGIGVRTSVFQASDFDLSDIPPNRIIINFDPVDHLRLDAQFGAYYSKDNENVGSSGLKPVDQQYVYGIGAHYLQKLDKAKFSAGLRYLLGDFANQFIYQDFNSVTHLGKDKEKTSSVAMVFGGEYFLSKWFSVGAELNVIHTVMDVTPDPNWGEENYTKKSTQTETCILFRFYPF